MKRGWLVNYRHEGSSNYTVWFCFLLSVWKLQLVWRADLAELGEVAPVTRCLCLVHLPSLGQAWPKRCKPVLCHHGRCCCHRMAAVVSSPLSIPASIAAGMATLASVCVPALPSESHGNRLWATCSSVVASGQPGPSAARDFCTAFLIPVQAFFCISCGNSGTFKLGDVERESFQVLLAFFLLNWSVSRVKTCLDFPRPLNGFAYIFLLSHSALQLVLFSFPRQLPSELLL